MPAARSVVCCPPLWAHSPILRSFRRVPDCSPPGPVTTSLDRTLFGIPTTPIPLPFFKQFPQSVWSKRERVECGPWKTILYFLCTFYFTQGTEECVLIVMRTTDIEAIGGIRTGHVRIPLLSAPDRRSFSVPRQAAGDPSSQKGSMVSIRSIKALYGISRIKFSIMLSQARFK